MQFLLSEEEFKTLIKEEKFSKFLGGLEDFQEKCTKICNTVPVKYWNNDNFKIWGCILNEKGNGCGYCDECLVQEICPNEYKQWSK